MSEYVGCIFYVVYLAMGFVQLLAIVAGVQEWLDIPWVLAGILALFLAYIPAIGTIVGIMGAAEAWGWSYLAAILFFCWPYLLYGVLALLVGTAVLFGRQRES